MKIDPKILQSMKERIAEGNKYLESIKGKKPVQNFDWLDDSTSTIYVDWEKDGD